MFTDYLKHIGLGTLAQYAEHERLNNIVADVCSYSSPLLSEEEIKNLYVYTVPKISLDGSCSLIDTPAEKPYNLAETFGLISDWQTLANHPQTIRLWRLNTIVKNIYKQTRVNWFGIYRKIQNRQSEWVLVKESYQGLFSRPEFPLTETFAKKSNNATVGITGKAKIIQDVFNNQGPYYKCDGNVQSEFCVPILNDKYQVIGIIDAESFTKKFFTNKRLLTIAKVAFDLGSINMGI